MMSQPQDASNGNSGPPVAGDGDRDGRRVMVQLHLTVGVILMLAKITLGLLFGSKALVVAAMFSGQHCIWAVIVLVRMKLGAKPTSQKHPFGFGKVEFVVAGCMSLLVLIAVVVLCGTITHSVLEHQQRAPSALAIWVALAVALICSVLSRKTRTSAKGNDRSALGTLADLGRADALASLLVAASVVVAKMGYELIDSTVAVGEAVYVVWCAGRMFHHATRGLMDASVGFRTIAKIEAAIREVDGVFDVSFVKAVQSGQSILASTVVQLSDAMTIAEADRVRERIGAVLSRRVDHMGQVLVGFETRDEYRRDERADRWGTTVELGMSAGGEES